MLLSLSANDLFAQAPGGGGGGGGRGGRGGFDPAQRMNWYKEQLEFKDDAEWKAVQPLLQKVMDARMATFRGAFGGRRGGGGPGGGGGGNNSNPEADALQKAIDSKATDAELKAAVAKVMEARKAKQADLEKAQNDLRKVLTIRQEAKGISIGLL